MRSVSGSFFSMSMRLHPAEAAEVALHAGDVDLEEIQADVALRDEIERRARRVHRALDLDRAARRSARRTACAATPRRAPTTSDGDERDVAQR